MASPKYNPLDIATSLIPKRWLDTPMVSYNDAENEYQKLQQQTAAAENAQTISKRNKSDLASDEEIATNFQKKRDENIAAGGDGSMTDEQIYDLVRDSQLKYGQGVEAVNTLLKKSELERRRAADEKEANKKEYKGFAESSNIYEVGDDGLKLIKKGNPKPSKNDIEIPFTVFNPGTGEEKEVKNKAEQALAYAEGFTVKKNSSMSDSEIDYQKRKLGRSKSPEGVSGPSSSSSAEASIDMRFPPGSKILQNPKNPKERVVRLPDGTVQPLP